MGRHLNHIPASASDIAEYFSYDAETGVITWAKNTGYVDFVGSPAGKLNRNGYREISFSQKVYSAHRLAWRLHYGEWPDKMLDHINGDRSDNRLSNLRLATNSQNMMNRGSTRPDMPKGVFREGQRYRAQIRANKVRYQLGTYSTPEEAHAAYCEAAKRLHGEFARVA